MKETLQITICGIPHTIHYIDKSNDANMGKWIEKKQVIELDESMKHEVSHYTLIHEILHCILVMQGDKELGENEDFINRLSTSILNSSFNLTLTRSEKCELK